MAEWVSTLLVALGGAVFGSGGVLVARVKLRELADKRDESEIGRLREDVRNSIDAHRECQDSVKDLQERLQIIEHHHTSYLARWIMDADQRVTWLNDKAYLSIFAPLRVERERAVGIRFGDILDSLAAGEIEMLVQAALAHPEVAASNVIQLHPLLPVMVVVKTAAIGRGGELVFEGYAYRTNDRMVSDGLGAVRQQAALEASGEHMIDGPHAAD